MAVIMLDCGRLRALQLEIGIDEEAAERDHLLACLQATGNLGEELALQADLDLPLRVAVARTRP